MTGRDAPSTYIHGTSPVEQSRLALMNSVLNPPCLARLALRPGERVLECGAGIGLLAREMARAVGPSGRVVAVERDAEQLATARRLAALDGEEELVDFRQGEAPRLPLDDLHGRFDVAHARFLLEHVRDPPAIVGALGRAVRPGGRVVLADDDHEILRLWPAAPAVDALWRAYWRAYEPAGNDPLVGRKLVALLHGAGLVPRACDWIFFGACRGQPSFAPLLDNLAAILVGAQAALHTGGTPSATIVAGLDELSRWRERPDAALWFAMSWAVGERPVT